MLFRTFIISSFFLLASSGSISQPPADLTPAVLAKCVSRSTTALPVQGALAADDEHVFLGTADGVLSAFGSKNLEVLWRADIGGEFVSSIAVIDNGILVVTNTTSQSGQGGISTLRLIPSDSGIPSWTAKLPFSARYHLGRINGSTAAVSQEGLVVLLDSASGTTLWQVGPVGKLSARPAFSPTGIALATQSKELVVVAAKSASIVSRQTTSALVTSVAFVGNENIAAGDERGGVVLFGERHNRSIWRFKSGGAITFITETGDGILVTSLDNFVYLISDYNGDVIWKKRLSGRVVEGGTMIGGLFAVLIYGENSAYLLDLKTGKLNDAQPPSDVDIINRVPVAVGGNRVVVSAIDGLSLYSLSGCGSK